MNRLVKNAFRFAVLLAIFASSVQATGFLTLESSPSGAEIWYTGPDDPDMKYLGDTPLENRELPVGRYSFQLILTSHDTLAIPEVYIAEGQVTQLNREIPTHYGYLEVNTLPDSAVIWLDGVKIGPSPYVNNLVLPGTSRLKVVPLESHFKTSTRRLSMAKGDSVRLEVTAPYRDKSFLHENLSLPAWRFQFEAGLEFRSKTADFDTAGKKVKYSSDSLPSQWDYPLAVRLGLPQGFEMHLMLPFKNGDDLSDAVNPSVVFPSNMRLGAKYTYRPSNVGLDLSYGFGFKNSSEALNHDFLALTVIAMASKEKILGEAQAGFEFHFTEKGNNKMDPGDLGFVHAQVGYLVDPFLPYLGLTVQLQLESNFDGESRKDGGYLVIPEPGLIIDVADKLSLQFGVPFTLIGKQAGSYWGIHLSFTLGVSML